MSRDNHPPVRLLTDRHRAEGVPAGSTGVILDVYDDTYEVEFSRQEGTTIAWFAVRHDEVAPCVDVEDRPLARRGA